MARTTGPLLSMDASGSVGNSLTFAKWKGRNYVRRWAMPSNPKTTGQTSIRSAMQYYSSLYKANKATIDATYADIAASLKISPFNAFVQVGMKDWKSSIVVTPSGLEIAMGITSANIALNGVAQPRGIMWVWSESEPDTPNSWILAVREAADPGVSTQYAVHGTAVGNQWLQTGLKGGTTYQARVTYTTASGLVKTKSTAVSVATP